MITIPATIYGKSGTALLFVPGSANPPAYCEIGSGSGTKSDLTSGLVAPLIRKAFTTTSLAIAREFTNSTDFTNTEMSGIGLRETGVFSSGPLGSGTSWSAEGFSEITFDGSNDLRVEITYEIF